MKMYMKITPNDEIAIDAIPLATKPSIIVDWKIIKEGKISSYYLIRVDGSSKRYSSMIQMLQHIDREDLESLWKLVKAMYGNIRPEEGYERVLWGDLKEMFKLDIEKKSQHRAKVNERLNQVSTEVRTVKQELGAVRSDLSKIMKVLSTLKLSNEQSSPKGGSFRVYIALKEGPKQSTLQFDDIGFPIPHSKEQPEGSNRGDNGAIITGRIIECESLKYPYLIERILMGRSTSKITLSFMGMIEETVVGEISTVTRGYFSAVRVMQPEGLYHAMKLSIMIDDNKLNGVVGKSAPKPPTGGNNAGQIYNGSDSTHWSVNNSKIKLTSAPTGQLKAFKRLMDAKIAEKRSKGICFRCDEKFPPGHTCASKTLHVLLVRDEEEDEDSDPEHVHLDSVEVSLNFVMGFTTPRTMKIQGIDMNKSQREKPASLTQENSIGATSHFIGDHVNEPFMGEDGIDGHFDQENFNNGATFPSSAWEANCVAVSASTWVEPNGKYIMTLGETDIYQGFKKTNIPNGIKNNDSTNEMGSSLTSSSEDETDVPEKDDKTSSTDLFTKSHDTKEDVGHFLYLEGVEYIIEFSKAVLTEDTRKVKFLTEGNSGIRKVKASSGLPNLFDDNKIRSSLQKIYDFNVMKVRGGRMRAVNGMHPNGKGIRLILPNSCVRWLFVYTWCRPMRKKGCATWDGGNSTWGGRVRVFGTVLVSLGAQEIAWGRGEFLAGKTGWGHCLVVRVWWIGKFGPPGLEKIASCFRYLRFGNIAEMVLVV
uniref:Non-lysosomal glucosylceramidase-like isoform X2 n=1 Tax=Tanacetum cinerariifolium TaxID=118510 RepID=A0A6L2NTF0_TANCI|nr:non-lysosomal glucosylceramidase-like isoform X2 [Tanacetum cinerariifolium]